MGAEGEERVGRREACIRKFVRLDQESEGETTSGEVKGKPREQPSWRELQERVVDNIRRVLKRSHCMW